MKVNWDYSNLAAAYAKRPAYSFEGIRKMIGDMGLLSGGDVCDIGAGTGHLTVELMKFPFRITAVEPNDAMRSFGMERTRGESRVRWFEGTGENTGQPSASFELTTFGSSFNVVDRDKTIQEVRRILKPAGWFACMWNHRDLTDPLQARIEDAIRRRIPGYDYGLRRQDQTEFLKSTGAFREIRFIDAKVMHEQSAADCYEAWRSHATLERQAGAQFGGVLADIRQILDSLNKPSLTIPYDTRIWYAQLRG